MNERQKSGKRERELEKKILSTITIAQKNTNNSVQIEKKRNRNLAKNKAKHRL